jgi:membrane associated rhomboid family serine protease
MGSFLAKLERRFGGLAIENLPLLIVLTTAAAYVLGQMRPAFLSLLELNLEAVKHGQVWRLFTYLFIPRNESPLWFFFDLYMIWLVGSSLEGAWGTFKLNLYYFVGMATTTLAAWFTGGSVGNAHLNHSIFLAFATVFPDFQILVFFVLPMRMAWLGLLTAALMGYEFLLGDAVSRGAILAATGTYLLFFGKTLADFQKDRRVRAQAAVRREALKSVPSPEESIGHRRCALCGVQEEDGADIRVCSCEKCGGKARNLCLEHARQH